MSSVALSRSDRVFLCLGFLAALSFGSGMTRWDGTVPIRSRAFALTALTMENRLFLRFLIEVQARREGTAGYEILYWNEYVRMPRRLQEGIEHGRAGFL